MKVVEFHTFGSPEVLEIKEVAKPIPGDKEVLIKVHASTVTSGDVRVRSATFPPGFGLIGRLMVGFSKPRSPRLGNELAGIVEAVGKEVTQFKPGDAVFAGTGLGLGANAEYICLPADGPIALKPANLSFEEAAAVPFGALTSLIFLRDFGKIRSGQHVLIVGASGSLGTYALQLAKYFGAEVTAVCSTANVEMVKELGADEVIDYTQEDFTKNGKAYDIIFDTVGKASFSKSRQALKPGGLFLAAAGGGKEYAQMLWTSITGGKKVAAGLAVQRQEDMAFLIELIEAGQLKPVIDRHYPLEQIARAHKYVETGRKKGNVVIRLSQNT